MALFTAYEFSCTIQDLQSFAHRENCSVFVLSAIPILLLQLGVFTSIYLKFTDGKKTFKITTIVLNILFVVTITVVTFYSLNDFLMSLNILDTSFLLLINVFYSEDVL